MDGGLTFLPQPWVVAVDASSFGGGLLVSTSAGGAKTTAVDDKPPADDRTEAPAGSLGTVDFVLLGGFRRTGANARAADQALDVISNISINEFYKIKHVVYEKIPAVGFPVVAAAATADGAVGGAA